MNGGFGTLFVQYKQVGLQFTIQTGTCTVRPNGQKYNKTEWSKIQ